MQDKQPKTFYEVQAFLHDVLVEKLGDIFIAPAVDGAQVYIFAPLLNNRLFARRQVLQKHLNKPNKQITGDYYNI